MTPTFDGAIPASPSEAQSDESERFVNLGTLSFARFKLNGELEDLEQAIASQSRAIDLTPNNHSNMPERVEKLGVFMVARYERLGQLEDLEKAMLAYRRAVDLTSDGHPEKPERLTSFANSFNARFERLGELADLDQVIVLYRHAIELTTHDHVDMSVRVHSVLGKALRTRFERLGELDDLGQAIAADRRSVELSTDDDPDKPERLDNVGRSLLARFECSGELEDLKQAIIAHRQALELTPGDSPNRSRWYGSLGDVLLVRFEHNGDVQDLEEAISVYHYAIALLPDDHPSKPEKLGSLGNALLTLFERKGGLPDLQQAVEVHRRALDLTPQGQLHVVSVRLRNLGQALDKHLQRFPSQSSFDEAAEAFMKAMTSPHSAPHERLKSAQGYLELLSSNPEYSSTEAVLVVHSHIISMLPNLVWLGFDIHRRSQECAKCGALVNDAVAAAIAAGSLDKAVEWLEAGRTIIFSQTLSLYAPLTALRDRHPSLAESLHSLRQQLQMSAHSSSAPQSSHTGGDAGLTINHHADRHRVLAIQYARILQEVRRQPGFEDFLCPKTFNALLPSLEFLSGPLIFINVAESCCDALILSPGGDTEAVALPELSLQRAQDLRTSWIANLSAQGAIHVGETEPIVSDELEEGLKSLRGIMESLWVWVVGPILQALDLVNPTNVERLPCVTWCLTGPLTQLPLHAAGMYSDPNGPRVFNRVVSSYTPSLALLLRSHEGVVKGRQAAQSVLVVTQSNTPGFTSLVGVEAEGHQIVQTLLSNSEVTCQVLEGEEATVASVRAAIRQHRWVHLACHGPQPSEEAVQCALAFHDGPLSLADILGTTVDDAELAFLSASGTALGDEKIPEECMHLAAGMLVAGFKGVVAAMWEIGDRDPAIVMEAYYKEILRLRSFGTLGRGETGAAYALHEATRVLRERVGEENIVKWATYVHFGA